MELVCGILVFAVLAVAVLILGIWVFNVIMYLFDDSDVTLYNNKH